MSDVLIDDSSLILDTAEAAGDSASMKWVSCIIRPESLDAVKDALSQLHVVGGMMITDVRGFGRQKGSTEHYRGESYVVRFLPKVRIDIAVQAEDVEAVLSAVRSAAQSGQVGDGKAFITGIQGALRIRTGDRGASAL